MRNHNSIIVVILTFCLLLHTCWGFNAGIFQVTSKRNVIISPRCKHFRSTGFHLNIAASSTEKTALPESRSSYIDLSRFIIRSSWVSWWIQIILSVISSVILTFANTVRTGGMQQSFWSSGFAFSSLGVLVAFANTFWTWIITRLCRQVGLKKVDSNKVVPLFRRNFRISIGISLFGMLLSLLGAEQIVGNLASKILSIQGFTPYAYSVGPPQVATALQALDIFLVQANTNAILANYVPCLTYILLQSQLPFPPYAVNNTTSTSVPTVDE